MGRMSKFLYALGVPLVSDSDIHNIRIPEKEEYNIAMLVLQGDKKYSEYLRITRLSSRLDGKLEKSSINQISDEETLFVNELNW